LLRGALDRRRKPFAVERGDVRLGEAHDHAETPGFCGEARFPSHVFKALVIVIFYQELRKAASMHFRELEGTNAPIDDASGHAWIWPIAAYAVPREFGR
jgi:hypothetical protein